MRFKLALAIDCHTYRLHFVSDAHNEFMLFSHRVHELHRNQVGTVRLQELLSCPIQRSPKPVSDGEDARSERRDEILASSCSDDGVMGTGDGWAMVRRHHQAHF